MVSRLTRLLVVLQIAIAAALCMLATAFWQAGFWTGILFGLGSVLLVRLLINANNFCIAWRYRSQTPSSLQLGWRQALKLFATEFAASMTSSSWTMAFHSFSARPAIDPVGLPVLLIHGYGCNSGYWHSLSKRLAHERITHHAMDLEPILAAIDDYVPAILRAVETLCKMSGHDKIVIVAHSMGGLAARAYLRDHSSLRVARVITLGTPHRGTALAHFGSGSNSRQMRWTGNAEGGAPSEWLRKLEQAEDAATRALFVSIYSHHDNIISPQISSHLAGAANVELHGIGHVALASNGAIQDRVVAEIHAASRTLSFAATPTVRAA
jgi:pimeloyl-ACP methyl ester carboxylesterase